MACIFASLGGFQEKMLVDRRLELLDKVGGAREARIYCENRVEMWMKV